MIRTRARKRHLPSALIVLMLLTAACTSSEPTVVTQVVYQTVEGTPITTTPTRTLPPTATPTTAPTPTTTPTPLPPTRFTYIISVLDPVARTVHVRLEITELHKPLPVLTFWTNAGRWYGDWLDPLTNAANIQATDDAGNPLPVSFVSDGIEWTGDGLRIDAEATSGVTVEYDMPLGVVDQNFTGDRQQLIGGYMNSQFAVAEPEFLLLAPVDVETSDYVMTVTFDLPEDQVSVTHWERLDQHSYSIDAADKAFSYGAIAFGQISSEEETVGQTEVRVAAYGIAVATFDQMADNTFRLYEYYEAAFGASPIPAFVLIYVPDVTDNQYLAPYNEQTGGFFMRYLPWHNTFWSDNIAHPIAHNWIGGGIHGEQWFQEGFVNYYELKSCEAIGLYSHSFVQRELIDRLTRYSTEIVGTEYDLSLVVAADRYNRDHSFPYNFLTYEKGSLFAYLLDLVVAQVSEGEKDLDDVVAVIWSRYSDSPRHNIGVSEVQQAVEEVTGQDFNSFFNAYLRGTDLLPLEMRQGEVVLGESVGP